MEKLYLIIVSFIAPNVLSVSHFHERISVEVSSQDPESSFKLVNLAVGECGVNEACVRFCCSNKTDCLSQEYLNISDLPEAKFLKPSYRALKGKPECAKRDMYEERETWMFLEDGSVKQYLESGNYTNSPQEYCIKRSGSAIVLKICFPKEDDSGDDNTTAPVGRVKAAYPILMLLSIPFLLVTFFVYGCLKELQNLHGRCLMCYLLGLMSMFLSFSLIQLNHEKLQKFQSLCTTTGYVAYISFLICFFWLNIMCYDIYSKFRGFQNQQNYKSRGSDRRRFLCYCLYAFGLPVVITGFVILVGNSTFIPSSLQVKMGEERCWIKNSKITELIYVYFPVSLGLLINIMFYSTTAYKIYRVQKDTSMIRDERHSKVNVEEERFFLYLRLFIVMGATWIVDSVSWALGNSLVFHITDILNCLQGVLIFFLFVWKPKIKNLIFQTFSSKWKSSSSFNPRYSTRTASLRLSEAQNETAA